MDGRRPEPQLTFSEHVAELRRRLAWPALALVAAGSIGYALHAPIIRFLQKPLHQTLYYTTPAGNFNFIMKVCFILGLTVAIPLLIYSLVTFIEPAINKKLPKRSILTVTWLSLILGVGGAAFAYYVVVPMSLHFFMGFKISGINPLISADDYLNFILTAILSFILMFQLPLLILFINHITPLQPRKLLKYERHVIVGALVIALILPFTYDPLTQFLIAAPIIILYNLSVLFLWVANRKRAKPQPKQIARTQPKPVPAPMPTIQVRKPDISAPQTNMYRPAAEVTVKPTAARPVSRRPALDFTPALPRRNFLDLRPSGRTDLNRVQ